MENVAGARGDKLYGRILLVVTLTSATPMCVTWACSWDYSGQRAIRAPLAIALCYAPHVPTGAAGPQSSAIGVLAA